MKKIIASTFLVASIVSPLTLAAGAAGSGPNPFSDCGIGGAIFANTAWAAVTSNVIWDLGTTGVTSATASPETCNGQALQSAKFIIENYENLAQETAKGEGVHLTTALNIMECNGASHGEVISSIRSQMAVEVAQTSYNTQHIVEKSNAYYQILNHASQGCSA